MSNLINIFTEEKYSVDNLSNNSSKIIVNPKDRVIWIAGMPYGNRFIPVNDNGIDTDNLPNNSEVFNDLENNKASGDYSHAEGLSTETNNVAEHACGKYNKSQLSEQDIPGTIFSVGTGTDNDNRKNAIEVREDDKVYISGIGNYNGEGEIKDLSTVINEMNDKIGSGTGGGDISNSKLVNYKISEETNENLQLSENDYVVEAFGKLEKAIIDNEQVFTNATENIAYSVGLDESLSYKPTGIITSGSSNISESIKILDNHISSISSGADYAEMFEWEDGNSDSEDRIGYFVELNGNKIIKSHSLENTIGIVSGTASVVSDNPYEWHNKYLKDKWGRYLKDDNGNIILNPEYDKTKEYQYRFFRKEWDAIGLIGKLFVRQDGTLSVGCKCKPSKNGIATLSNDNTGYYVLEIIDDEVARILFK